VANTATANTSGSSVSDIEAKKGYRIVKFQNMNIESKKNKLTY
jgi:hypothetical protein